MELGHEPQLSLPWEIFIFLRFETINSTKCDILQCFLEQTRFHNTFKNGHVRNVENIYENNLFHNACKNGFFGVKKFK